MGTGLLTATGFDPKRLADVKSDLEAAFRAEFGQSINLDPSTEFGKLLGIQADRETTIWERLEEDYDSHFPGTATGVSLDLIAEITAIVRNPALRSTVTLYMRGTNVTIPASSIVETSDTAIQFRTINELILGATGDIPLAAGTADISITTIVRSGTVASVTTAAPHNLVAGAVVTVSGANETEYNVTAEIENIGASTFDYNMASDPGGSATGTLVYQVPALAADHLTFANPMGRSVAHGLTTGDFIFVHDADQIEYNGLFAVVVLDVDHFTYTPSPTLPTVTPATGSFNADDAVPVLGESVALGPVIGLSGTITVISTPISGWGFVQNDLDAVLGNLEETDTEFRTRRLAALAGLGNATFDAILAALVAVLSVTDVSLFVNDTGLTVAGRPPHSFEALVLGGAEQTIRDAIFANKAAGIEAFGSVSGTVTDSQGNSHNIDFSRPTSITIFLDITLTVDADYPVDGDTLVENLVNAFGDSLGIGVDVVVFPYLIASFESVPGILDVVIDIGTSSSPSGDANIAIAATEIADFDSSRTTVMS